MGTPRKHSKKYSISLGMDLANWLERESAESHDMGNISHTIQRLLWPAYQDSLRRADISALKKQVSAASASENPALAPAWPPEKHE